MLLQFTQMWILERKLEVVRTRVEGNYFTIPGKSWDGAGEGLEGAEMDSG